MIHPERKTVSEKRIIITPDGDRIGVASEPHNGKVPHTQYSLENCPSLPAHHVANRKYEGIETTLNISTPSIQEIARTDIDKAKRKAGDDWVYSCPVLRREIDDIESLYDTIKETRWIKTRHDDGADPRLNMHALAFYYVRDFMPKWALEELADRMDIDGWGQIASHRLVKLEKELADENGFEWDNEIEMYRWVSDRYNLKFTAEELREIEETQIPKIDWEQYEAEKKDIQDEWVEHCSGEVSSTSWYAYNQGTEGPSFPSVEEAREWLVNIEEKWESEWEKTLEEKTVTPEKTTAHAVKRISETETPEPTKTNNIDKKVVVYREWLQARTAPALDIFCSKCGEKVYQDFGNKHNIDPHLRFDCPSCETELNAYNMVTIPSGEFGFDTIPINEKVKNSLKSYWNRGNRYGFVLADKISIRLKFHEFERYADMFGVEWEPIDPWSRKSLDDSEAEGIRIPEHNHTVYKDEKTNKSVGQIAAGCTLSRVGHDEVSLNVMGYYLENYILEDFDVEWLEFQTYKFIEHELPAYQALYDTDASYNDDEFLKHVAEYYDVAEVGQTPNWLNEFYKRNRGTEWMVEAYDKVEPVIDDIYSVFYDDKFDHYLNWFKKRTDKTFIETKEDARKFMEDKKERNEEWRKEWEKTIENRELEQFEGDKMSIQHDTVSAYQPKQ